MIKNNILKIGKALLLGFLENDDKQKRSVNNTVECPYDDLLVVASTPNSPLDHPELEMD